MVRGLHAHHSCISLIVLCIFLQFRELAELLGQVKPPTATREDIDNSGLQIIKASEMKRCEEEGKVASNCTDRVRVSWLSDGEVLFSVAELLACHAVSGLLG